MKSMEHLLLAVVAFFEPTTVLQECGVQNHTCTSLGSSSNETEDEEEENEAEGFTV